MNWSLSVNPNPETIVDSCLLDMSLSGLTLIRTFLEDFLLWPCLRVTCFRWLFEKPNLWLGEGWARAFIRDCRFPNS